MNKYCQSLNIEENHHENEEKHSTVVGENIGLHSTPLTWHKILMPRKIENLNVSSGRASTVSSMFSDNVGSQISVLSNTEDELLNLRNTNLDSGNFSFTDSSSSHQQVVQLNNELYQTKTELLAYKYKWNEIKNEVEHKYLKLQDENSQLLKEKKGLEEYIKRCNDEPFHNCEKDLELLNTKAALEEASLKLQCKEDANKVLKDTIVTQHCDIEKASEKYKNLEKSLLPIQHDLKRLKISENWFKNELHASQTQNAKLRESNLSLEDKLIKENLKFKHVQNECRKLMKICEEIEQKALKEKEILMKKLQNLENNKVNELLIQEFEEKVEILEEENMILKQKNLKSGSENDELQESLTSHEFLLNSMKNLIEKFKDDLKNFKEQLDYVKSEKLALIEANNTLISQINIQNYDRRKIDVGVEQLRANFNVLSINYETVKTELQNLQPKFENEQRMNNELRENLKKIETQNLNLEIKLGDSEVKDKKIEEMEKCGDEMKRLKVLVRVIESENKHKLKRYEITNRTLLREVKKQIREKKKLEIDGPRSRSIQKELDKLQEKYEAIKLEAINLSSILREESYLTNNNIIASVNSVLKEIKLKSNENNLLKAKLSKAEQKVQEANEKINYLNIEMEHVQTESESKSFEIEDYKKALENSNRQKDSLGETLMEKMHVENALKDEIRSLKDDLHSKMKDLEIINDKLRLYEESDQILLDSKTRFFDDMQMLKDEIMFIQEEKIALQDMIKYLRGNINHIMESNIYKLHNNNSSILDIGKIKALLEQSSNQSHSLQPLEECVNSLKTEMSNLKAVIRENSSNRYQLSLMEEINNATGR